MLPVINGPWEVKFVGKLDLFSYFLVPQLHFSQIYISGRFLFVDVFVITFSAPAFAELLDNAVDEVHVLQFVVPLFPSLFSFLQLP